MTAGAFQPALTANPYDGSDWFFSILGSGAISRVLPAASDLQLGGRHARRRRRRTAGRRGERRARLRRASIVSNGSHIAVDGWCGGRETFGFSLDGVATPGSYDLVVTNPDGTTITKKARAFTVQAVGPPVLSVQVLGGGRGKFRTGWGSRPPSPGRGVEHRDAGSPDHGLAVVVFGEITFAMPFGQRPPFSSISIDNFSVARRPRTAMLGRERRHETYVEPVVPVGKLSAGRVDPTIAVHRERRRPMPRSFVPVTAALAGALSSAPSRSSQATLMQPGTGMPYDSDCVAGGVDTVANAAAPHLEL